MSGKGFNVEVLVADHLNKPDVGTTIARQWFDRDGVDLIVEVANSGVALAVANVAKEKNKVYLNSGAATSDLTGSGLQRQHHPLGLRHLHAGAVDRRGDGEGGRRFLVLHHRRLCLRQGAAARHHRFRHRRRRQGAGQRRPIRSPAPVDFSSYLIQAQASGAKVLGIANAGADTINTIKQAKEFGIKMQLAGLLLFLTDVHSLGLDVAQGIALTDSFYWDMNAARPGVLRPVHRECARACGRPWCRPASIPRRCIT